MPITRRRALQYSLASIATQVLMRNTGASAVAATSAQFAPRARRAIMLFQSGGPSQLDLFDYKPQLAARSGQEVPESVYPAARKTTQTSAQKAFLTAPSMFRFNPHGRSGTFVSELLPYTAGVVDDICVVRSTVTDAINHDPAITFALTGFQRPGQPSVGSWISYGLGSENENLPTFVVLVSRGGGDQPLYSRLWGSGFLPAQHQGTLLRSQGAAVLDLADPPGVDRQARRELLDSLGQLNRLKFAETGDPETLARIAQYELAFRMQTSIPDFFDLSNERRSILDSYGPDASRRGTYAHNCLLARRLLERGVRFVQLMHRGWDQHGDLPRQIRKQCRDTDQPTAALVNDLKQRGLLDDTLVIWCGEFGRTVYAQGVLTNGSYGRDHHAACFSTWLAGGGVKGGMTYGRTDDYSANVVESPVSVHDLHATMLHLLGLDHQRLTYRHQGRDFRLTDVDGNVVTEILA